MIINRRLINPMFLEHSVFTNKIFLYLGNESIFRICENKEKVDSSKIKLSNV